MAAAAAAAAEVASSTTLPSPGHGPNDGDSGVLSRDTQLPLLRFLRGTDRAYLFAHSPASLLSHHGGLPVCQAAGSAQQLVPPEQLCPQVCSYCYVSCRFLHAREQCFLYIADAHRFLRRNGRVAHSVAVKSSKVMCSAVADVKSERFCAITHT